MSPLRVSILAVIVLYRISVANCISLQSLLRSRMYSDDPELELTVLVVDNTPQPEPIDCALPGNVRVLHCPQNLGLANAYNQGLRLAHGSGATWLLTLDQDTQLPATFLGAMSAHARRYQHDPGIGAILPRVQDGTTSLSPFFNRWSGWPAWFAKDYVGLPQQAVFGINSASMLRVDAMNQAGGYDPLFWLDCSDMAIFSRLHRLGKRVLVAGDVEAQHELSLLDVRRRMSPERYRHMLLAESAFWDAEMGPLAGLERTARLALRLCRQAIRRDPAALQWITLGALFRRLCHSSGYRRRLFLKDVEQRLGSNLSKTAYPSRAPKLSVCMASYNSGHFIDLQLGSILPQLRVDDEVVIVDDHSNDDTALRIRKLDDPRIRLIEHDHNAGVTASFEQALRAATGDILFLSDHDDLWAPDKVRLFREAFALGEHIQLVTSAVSLIDTKGIPFRDKRWDRDGQFRRGFFRNVLKNNYQGSALALRSRLLAPLLPFPADRTYLHDAWIGTMNDRLQGGIVFLKESLLLYRRHAANVSRSMSLKDKLVSRTQLIVDHLWRALLWRG